MKVKTLQGLSAEEQNRGQQKQQERDAERNPRRRALPDRNDRSPERTATHQNNETGARKIQNDRRNENTECHEPEEPAFSAVTKVVLSARQQHNRCDAKKIGSLISVRERPEAALINPKRKSRVRQVECDAYPSQGNDACDKKPKLKTNRTKLEFLCADDIEPAHSRDQTNKTTHRHPRLRRDSRRERDCEIINQCAPPCRHKKPAHGQEGDCR